MRGIGLVPNWKKENSALVVERICDFFDQRGITVLTAGPGQTDYLSGSLEEKLAQWQGRVEMLPRVVGGGRNHPQSGPRSGELGGAHTGN